MRLSTLAAKTAGIATTKRNILRITASLYDPLGLISPIIIPMKILFQELCRDNRGWDEPLSEPLAKTWNDWITDLQVTHEIMGVGVVASGELHGFSDSSNAAYAGTVYLRITKTTIQYFQLKEKQLNMYL